MSDAIDQISANLRSQLRGAGEVTAATVVAEVRRFNEGTLGRRGEPVAERETAHAVMASLVGFGQLQPLLDDSTVEEIWINAPDAVFVARNGVAERAAITLTSDEVRSLVERMLARTGRRVDLSTPFVDASLPDGSRLHVVIPDITREHWSINIRKFQRNSQSLDSLLERQMLSRSAAEFLRLAVQAKLNIVVAGPTHAGKTTLLAALLAATGPSERIVTVEETFEIDCRGDDVVAMQCRPANLEGAGEIGLRKLVKEALRMRPDRLVVGEVREAESLDLLIALNSGVAGLATIHANSARDALLKLCTLPLLAGHNIDANFVIPTVAASVDLVVQCAMTPAGHRFVSEIIAPSGAHRDGAIEASRLFAAEQPRAQASGTRLAERVRPRLEPTGNWPTRRSKFDAAGIDLAVCLGRA